MKKIIFTFLLIFNLSFSLTPDEALKLLEKATISSKKVSAPTIQKIATLLSCSEMEVKINNIFNLPKEKLYIVNVLGNVALEPEIASIEYSLVQLQLPLIVVIGHYNCQIIDKVLKGKITENTINSIVETLNTSIEKAGMIYGTNYSETLFKQSVVLNVYNSMENLVKNSSIIKELIKMQKVKVIGAIYNEKRGIIEWLGEHPMQKEIIDGSYNSLEFLAFYKERQTKKNDTGELSSIKTEKVKNIDTKPAKNLKAESKVEKQEIKPKKTNIYFIMDKKVASPRKPAYITIRLSTFQEASFSELTVYAEDTRTGKRTLVFRLPKMKIINGLAQAQFYFAGRIFKKNLYLNKGNYRIVANVKLFNRKNTLIETKTFPLSKEENIIRLY